jgi:hypothetical protein
MDNVSSLRFAFELSTWMGSGVFSTGRLRLARNWHHSGRVVARHPQARSPAEIRPRRDRWPTGRVCQRGRLHACTAALAGESINRSSGPELSKPGTLKSNKERQLKRRGAPPRDGGGYHNRGGQHKRRHNRHLEVTPDADSAGRMAFRWGGNCRRHRGPGHHTAAAASSQVRSVLAARTT